MRPNQAVQLTPLARFVTWAVCSGNARPPLLFPSVALAARWQPFVSLFHNPVAAARTLPITRRANADLASHACQRGS